MTGGLVALAAAGGAGAVGAAVWRRDRDYLPGSLAVALDGSAEPLPLALRLGYAGLEIALRLDGDGDLRMTAGEPEPLFERAVLAPLAARLTGSTTGRVHRGSRESFQLLLRLARHEHPTARTHVASREHLAVRTHPTDHDRPTHHDPQTDTGSDPHEAYAELDELLGEYTRILTRANARRITPGPVRVVLVGPDWPRETVAEQDDRLVFLERDLRAPDEPRELAPLVTCALAPLLGWDPREPWVELPAEARHILRSLVREAHADRRQIRFVDVPDRPRAVRQAFWRELHAAGADYIGGRDLAALARFLRGPLPWAGRPHSHRASRPGYAAANAQ